MLKKYCPHCSTVSFGSNNDFWICPGCNKDITKFPYKEAEVSSKSIGILDEEDHY